MSGTTIFIDSDGDVDPSVINGFFPPVSDGLIGYYELTSAAVAGGTVVNLANPALPALIIGSPLVEANGITLTSNASGLNTQLTETADLTWLSVINPGPLTTAATGTHALIGNTGASGYTALMGGQSAGGTTGYFRTAAYYSAGSPLFANPALFQNEATGWRVRGGRVGTGIGVLTEDRTLGTSAVAARTEARAPATGTILIGTANSGSHTGPGKHLRHIIYNRRLTDAEMATMTAFIRADVLSRHGVVA